MDFRRVELATLWAEASIQLNGFVKTIKLTGRSFGMLGPDGETYFGREAATLLGKNTEFLGDASNPSRVYLGNPIDIERETNGVIHEVPGSRLRIVRPGIGGGPTHKNAANYLGISMTGMNEQLTFNASGHHASNNPMTPVSARSQGSPGSSFQIPGGQSASATSGDDGEGLQTNRENNVKQPPNGFVLWRMEYSKMLRQQNPNLHQTVISSMSKEAWAKMPKSEKKALCERAQVAMEEFKKTHPDHFKDRAAASKRRKAQNQDDQSRPKRQKTTQKLPAQQPQQPLLSPVQQMQDQIVYQAPMDQMEMIQPQLSAGKEKVMQIQDNNGSQIQEEQPEGVDKAQETPLRNDEPFENQNNQEAQAPEDDLSSLFGDVTNSFSFDDLIDFGHIYGEGNTYNETI
ncbi:hypothetical protein GQX73_g8316 [Xylaria multiplex]|uniref:HMG box domain-containing protein n=1 Tax=Xylaria multiplex TaxID=323545 RepID=A0A7C8IJS7_9PEZI|nr:hypothetical protein GQX73_g8316 [Xylaria multiplex]